MFFCIIFRNLISSGFTESNRTERTSHLKYSEVLTIKLYVMQSQQLVRSLWKERFKNWEPLVAYGPLFSDSIIEGNPEFLSYTNISVSIFSSINVLSWEVFDNVVCVSISERIASIESSRSKYYNQWSIINNFYV